MRRPFKHFNAAARLLRIHTEHHGNTTGRTGFEEVTKSVTELIINYQILWSGRRTWPEYSYWSCWMSTPWSNMARRSIASRSTSSVEGATKKLFVCTTEIRSPHAQMMRTVSRQRCYLLPHKSVKHWIDNIFCPSHRGLSVGCGQVCPRAFVWGCFRMLGGGGRAAPSTFSLLEVSFLGFLFPCKW